jgi:hypothetical protein
MKVRLLKKWDNKGKCYAMGTTLEVADQKAKELIRDNVAEKYTGEYPPKQKMKTEFFKPKIKRNGKG